LRLSEYWAYPGLSARLSLFEHWVNLYLEYSANFVSSPALSTSLLQYTLSIGGYPV